MPAADQPRFADFDAFLAAYRADENACALIALLGGSVEDSAASAWADRCANRASVDARAIADKLTSAETARVVAAFEACDADGNTGAASDIMDSIAQDRRTFASGVAVKDCPKCSGRGTLNGYEHICGGVCFRCGGCGKVAA